MNTRIIVKQVLRVWLGLLIWTTLSQTVDAGTFKLKKSVIKDVDGHTVQTLIIQTDTDELTFVPLYGYETTLSEKDQRIDFKSPDGKIACAMVLTNTFAGITPDEDQLKAQAAALYPGSSVLLTGAAVAPSGNGRFVDVFRVYPNGARMTTRHAYLPFRDQTLEVIYTTDSKVFDKNRREVAALINTFKIEPINTGFVMPETPKP
jgi:hypothetical protein